MGGPLCKLAFGKVETRNKLSNDLCFVDLESDICRKNPFLWWHFSGLACVSYSAHLLVSHVLRHAHYRFSVVKKSRKKIQSPFLCSTGSSIHSTCVNAINIIIISQSHIIILTTTTTSREEHLGLFKSQLFGRKGGGRGGYNISVGHQIPLEAFQPYARPDVSFS